MFRLTEFKLRARKWVGVQKFLVKRFIIARLTRRMIEAVSYVKWTADSLHSAPKRSGGLVREEIAIEVLNLPPGQSKQARVSVQLERLIDQRIYFGRSVRGREEWRDLEAVARIIAAKTMQLRHQMPDRP